MTKKRISIKDIAELAGVSHPTVSRALRGQGRMSEDTRARIVTIAKEVGYTPSLMARGLVTQRSYCIGLIVPTFSDPFHSEVAQGIEEEARRHHYSLFLASTDVDTARELEVARSFHGRQVDGIIVSASRVGNGYTTLIEETGIPLVTINTMAESDQLYTIDHDDYSGGCQLINHLIARGHRRIAYLGNLRAGKASMERKRAWLDTMRAARLEPELAMNGPNGRIEGGVSGALMLLEEANARWGKAPDAIYAYNDTMAIGAMSVLRRNGLHIPQEVAVTGFDDLDLAAVIEPPLTTIHQPRHAMGVRAMEILRTLMEDSSGSRKATMPRHAYIPGKLIIRDSA